jgi:hypothetical protein
VEAAPQARSVAGESKAHNAYPEMRSNAPAQTLARNLGVSRLTSVQVIPSPSMYNAIES